MCNLLEYICLLFSNVKNKVLDRLRIFNGYFIWVLRETTLRI